MSVGVFTPELRFKWVKGQVTSGTPDAGFVACGDGTAFPMEVTVDQLAEIMYRVRDSRFDSGSFYSFFYFGDPLGDISISTGAPSDDPSFDDGDVVVNRSYSSGDALPTDERKQWEGIPAYVPSDHADFDFGSNFPCGFSHEMLDTVNDSDDATRYTVYSAGAFTALTLQFAGAVAWVDIDGSGNPLSAGNKLYIEMILDGFGGGGDLIFAFSTSTKLPMGGADVVPLDANLVFALASGDCSCPIYSYHFLPSESASGSDLILRPTKWWPYAKDSPAAPVWDATTGARIP